MKKKTRQGIPRRVKHVRIMGVLNVTPDSFSDGGVYLNAENAVRRAMEMAACGADILDIGGESSRPGAQSVTVEEELDRVIPVIKAIKGSLNISISVDTCKSAVAREALKAGAELINDITALKSDSEMASVVANAGAGVVLMHMKGTPRMMQNFPRYDDVIEEIIEHLESSIAIAVGAGIDFEKIIIDPGIGFGKTLEHNLEILRRLGEFKRLGRPVLVGTSKKSFIGELTNREVGGRLFGTAASVAAAVLNGADIVRVHDVSEMRDVVRVAEAIKG